MRLLTAILARDEAGPDRFLRQVLQSAIGMSDQVLVLDDGSEDDTVAVCQEAGAIVVSRETLAPKEVPPVPAWGAESAARRDLWELAVGAAETCKAWVLFQDADMILSADPRPLTVTKALNTWLWPLYDKWEPGRYRADGYWQAHHFARAWMVNPFRVPEGWAAEWSTRGIHCGHLPSNWVMWGSIAPPQYYWIHEAYSTPGARQRKHGQYLDQRDQLTPEELAHAQSILDPE